MFCFISKVVVVRWISVVDILDNLRGIGEMSHEPSPALNKHRIVTVLIFMDFFSNLTQHFSMGCQLMI